MLQAQDMTKKKGTDINELKQEVQMVRFSNLKVVFSRRFSIQILIGLKLHNK